MRPDCRRILTTLAISSKTFALVASVALLPLLTPAPAYAITDSEVWQNVIVQAQARKDPLAKKLAFWLSASDKSDISRPLAEMMNFIKNNPDWPRLWVMREKIERDIGGLESKDVIAWFKEYPPQTVEGIDAYVAALKGSQQTEEARTALMTFWQTGGMTKSQLRDLSTRHQSLFRPGDNMNRAVKMAWEERYSEAKDMLPMLSAGQAALISARISLALQLPDAQTLLQRVPAEYAKDEGLLFERLRWRRRQNQDAGAIEIIRQMPPQPAFADKWWKETNIMTRRLIEAGDYKTAYSIAQNHGMIKGADYAQAEFILGWLSLRFLKNPQAAFHHFDNLYRSVESAISRSRGAYWAARAADAAGSKDIAKQWDQVAAQYISTYYGQLSYRIAYGIPDAAAMADPPVDEASRAAFEKKDMVKVIRLLSKLKLDSYNEPFFKKLIDSCKTNAEFTQAAKLALETNNRRYAVQANKDIQQRQGAYIFKSGYPTFSTLPRKEPEAGLVHAIVYRESMFDKDAASTAGALGLMQLMPNTARAVSKKEGLNYSEKRLTSDPTFNLMLGSAYLQQMIDKYDGFYPLAIAAYNAGPGNVDKWVREFGNPKNASIDLVDWIEMIPIYETRNYVQRVMETQYMYNLKHKKQPVTVFDIARN